MRKSRLLFLTLVVYLLAGALRIQSSGHYSALLTLGCHPSICFADLNKIALPPNAYIYSSGGYDGQFYYYIAAEWACAFPPEANGRAGDGCGQAVVDAPPFRRARMGFVLLTHWLYYAGPRALALGMPLFLLISHIGLLWLILPNRASLLDLAFALNPIALFCFLLNLPDGLALNLALAGWLLWQKRNLVSLFAAWLVLSLSLLTKETMLAFVLAQAILLLPGVFFKKLRLAIRPGPVLFALSSVVPLAVWWQHVGFSFGLAARRSSFPLAGLLEHFQLTGATGAPIPETSWLLLVLLFFLASILAFGAIQLAAGASTFLRTRPPAGADRQSGGEQGLHALFEDEQISQQLLALAALTISLGLVSFASAQEYWSNFANAVRLYLPAMGAAFLYLQTDRLSAAPGRSKAGVLRIAFSLFILLFSVFVIVKEGLRRQEHVFTWCVQSASGLITSKFSKSTKAHIICVKAIHACRDPVSRNDCIRN